MAALLALDSDRQHIATVIAPNLPRKIADTLLTPVLPEFGPAATAILRQETLTVTDSARDDRWPDWLKDVSAQGCKHQCPAAFQPQRRGGRRVRPVQADIVPDRAKPGFDHRCGGAHGVRRA
ncbi:MAG: hypothetical protein U1E97_01415 [Alphaproteobacteria bacterium]